MESALETLAKNATSSATVQTNDVSGKKFFVGKQKYFYVSKDNNQINEYENLLNYVFSDLAGESSSMGFLSKVQNIHNLREMYPLIIAKMFSSILAYNNIIGPKKLRIIIERERSIQLGEPVYFVSVQMQDILIFQQDAISNYFEKDINLLQINYSNAFNTKYRHRTSIGGPPMLRNEKLITSPNENMLSIQEKEQIARLLKQEEQKELLGNAGATLNRNSNSSFNSLYSKDALKKYISSENFQNKFSLWLSSNTYKDMENLLMKMYIVADKTATHYLNIFTTGLTDWIEYKNLTSDVGNFVTAHAIFSIDYNKSPLIMRMKQNSMNIQQNQCQLFSRYLGKNIRKNYASFNSLSNVVETPLYMKQSANITQQQIIEQSLPFGYQIRPNLPAAASQPIQTSYFM